MAAVPTFEEPSNRLLQPKCTRKCKMALQVAYTAKGRAWNSFDGRLATTQNAVFLAVRYGTYVLPSSGKKAAKYLCWARAQARAMHFACAATSHVALKVFT